MKQTEESNQSGHSTSCEDCANCLKLIGIGLGYKCIALENQMAGKYFSVPHRGYACDYFSKHEITYG